MRPVLEPSGCQAVEDRPRAWARPGSGDNGCMDLRERLRQLRAAVATRDGETLLALLQDPWPDHSLQLIGDGLLDALGRDVTGAREPASLCVAALRERDWEGDEELAK